MLRSWVIFNKPAAKPYPVLLTSASLVAQCNYPVRVLAVDANPRCWIDMHRLLYQWFLRERLLKNDGSNLDFTIERVQGLAMVSFPVGRRTGASTSHHNRVTGSSSDRGDPSAI